MKLRTKVLVIIGVAIGSLVLILYATSQTVMLRSFDALEEQNTQQNVERAASALHNQLVTVLDRAGDDVRVVSIPAEYNVATIYASATVTGGDHYELAAQFQAFLTSDTGRAIMAARGFGPAQPSSS